MLNIRLVKLVMALIRPELKGKLCARGGSRSLQSGLFF